MQILEKTELDFSDVLIKPRRSTISSRKDADIVRDYKFKWYPKVIMGTGIMQSNMGTIGTFEVSKKMLESGLFACLHKHYHIDELMEFYQSMNDIDRQKCFLSIGLKDNGLEKVRKINETFFKDLGWDMSICIDVPNGYIPQVKQLVKDVRKEFPNCLLMVGNVVTGDIVEDLILSGADIVKCGIGNGSNCLVKGTMVKTKQGYKPIEDIEIGDEVETDKFEYHKVLNKVCYKNHHEKLTVNGVECTPEHKFMVIKKSDINKIKKECHWVEACKLNPDTHLLVRNLDNHQSSYEPIINSFIVMNTEDVFDIEVEKDHSFVVNDGIVVHNCLTRKQTGVGRPQFSTIVECADAAHQVGGMICADGGITCPGDLVKAFGGGADFIMIGGLYAGTDEADGEIIEKTYTTNEREVEHNGFITTHNVVYETKKYKLFYGMSSSYAQEKFGNGKPSYRASEGRVTLIPYSGSIDGVNEEFLGGLRSAMTYIGASKLKDIPKCCVFYKVNNQLNRIYENTTIGK
ncbi:MAG: IMP dehydrogenase [Lachnospiraceae bacterium]|nr:IMP dehydrogenase [Lachnospiraceae bacterium]